MKERRTQLATLLAFAMILASIFAFTACNSGSGSQSSSQAGTDDASRSVTTDEIVTLLADFDSTDIDGNPVDQSILSDYDLTMVNVWATYCNPCLREMPDLGELADEYETQGVQIVGLVVDVSNSDLSVNQEQVEVAKSIIDKTGADYLHIVPSEDLLDVLSYVSAVPTTFFVDKDGNQVGEFYIGLQNKSRWKSIIEDTRELLPQE